MTFARQHADNERSHVFALIPRSWLVQPWGTTPKAARFIMRDSFVIVNAPVCLLVVFVAFVAETSKVRLGPAAV